MNHTGVFGLIGYPLKHSFSKKYFEQTFSEERQKQICYHNFELARIEELVDVLRTPHLLGLNVTIPYKKEVLRFATEQSAEVQQIGAANCLHILPQHQRIVAYNTDIVGIQNTLRRIKPDTAWQQEKALILGTGGASLAVQYVLQKMGIPFLLVSRTPKVPYCISYETLEPSVLEAHRLVIQTTPLGTFPDVDQCVPLPYEAATPAHTFFDLVYNPSETRFLQRARQQGAHTVNGLYMLEQQAEASWHIWGLI